MRLIEITPQPCMICGTGNVPTSDGTPRVFIDLERDTFWDDPAILCEECALKISGLVGAPSAEEINAHKKQVRELKAENHELKTQLDRTKVRARRLGIQLLDDPAEDREEDLEEVVA